MTTHNGNKPCVTIFTDASVHHQRELSGWGGVILRDGEKVDVGGAFREHVSDITSAEIRAATNALHEASARGLLDGKPVIVLQIDNVAAISYLLGSNNAYRYTSSGHAYDVKHKPARRVPRVCDRPATDYVAALHERHNFVLMLRHVKAHKGRKGRHALNGVADKIAGVAAEND